MDRGLAEILGFLMKLMFGGLALLFWGVCIGVTVRNLVVINTYVKASGEVVSTRSTGSGKISTYEAAIKYSAPKGVITVTTREVFFNYSKGNAVTVYYDPDSPRDFYINSLKALWFLPLLFGILGSIVSYFVIRMFLDDRKAKLQIN